jgi:hypothetical protein
MKLFYSTLGLMLIASISWAQYPSYWKGKFEQLGTLLPTPNEYRTGSGAPGPKYWQQQADYVIDVELNDKNQSIRGKETITYTNNSPDDLGYLWLQLDQNILAEANTLRNTETNSLRDSLPAKSFHNQVSDFKGGYTIYAVNDASGKALPYIVNNTMMRVDLAAPLKSGEKISFQIEWSYFINDRNFYSERSGLEYFPEDDNYLYTIAQFFPRMCVYDDVEGWQNKQYLGGSEYALSFGNYKVKLTVPSDHIVAATGTLQNPKDVLTKAQLDRFEAAKKSFNKPVIIATQAEAIEREKSKATTTKTWVFHADSVRDFAFATSRKLIWDAQAVKVGKKTPLAMSFYPKEGNPLWERESTKAVKNTLEVYSHYTFDYPYPVAIAVHSATIGMEYPMICFNHGRPDKNGKYTEDKRRRMIGVIVHEIGHNFFPMIVNNDERQVAWMDEGMNNFLEVLTELERYPEMDWSADMPAALVNYMKSDPSRKRPLMTNPEQVILLGYEQYVKFHVGLMILRDVVMGPELFDKALKEYANRWAFKHPKPADFFRSFEDASAVDLDWFWKGWFFTTDYVDISIDQVKWFSTSKGVTKENVSFSNLDGEPQRISIIPTDQRFYGEFLNRADDAAILKKLENKNIYEITFSNHGGLVMPILLEWHYQDGSVEEQKIPAEVWRVNESKFSKIFIKDKPVKKVLLDPKRLTTDVNEENNVFPRVKK